MTIPYQILDAREERSFLQEELLNNYNLPLFVIRPNYPGLEKKNTYSQYISNTLFEYIKIKLKDETFVSIENIVTLDSYEGIIFLLSINIDPFKLKEIAIYTEATHPLGRLIDLDVLYLKNTSSTTKEPSTISRTDLGFPPRSCFICNSLAHLCVRSKKHTLKEVVKFIHSKVDNFRKKSDFYV